MIHSRQLSASRETEVKAIRIVFIEHTSCAKVMEEYLSGKDYAFQDMSIPDVIQNKLNKRSIGIGILLALCLAAGVSQGDSCNIISAALDSDIASTASEQSTDSIILNHIKCKID